MINPTVAPYEIVPTNNLNYKFQLKTNIRRILPTGDVIEAGTYGALFKQHPTHITLCNSSWMYQNVFVAKNCKFNFGRSTEDKRTALVIGTPGIRNATNYSPRIMIQDSSISGSIIQNGSNTITGYISNSTIEDSYITAYFDIVKSKFLDTCVSTNELTTHGVALYSSDINAKEPIHIRHSNFNCLYMRDRNAISIAIVGNIHLLGYIVNDPEKEEIMPIIEISSYVDGAHSPNYNLTYKQGTTIRTILNYLDLVEPLDTFETNVFIKTLVHMFGHLSQVASKYKDNL